MTIEDILANLTSGNITESQAADELHGLMKADQARDGYACAALSGYLATGARAPSVAEVARMCFEYADAMVVAKDQPSAAPESKPSPAIPRK